MAGFGVVDDEDFCGCGRGSDFRSRSAPDRGLLGECEKGEEKNATTGENCFYHSEFLCG
jgi:hypothetical protein